MSSPSTSLAAPIRASSTSPETLQKHAWTLGGALFLPLVLNALARILPFDVALGAALATGTVVAVAMRNDVRVPTSAERWLVAFGICFLIVGTVNYVREGRAFMVFLARHSGVFLALAITIYATHLDRDVRREVLRRVIRGMAFIFLMQCAFSVFESLSGEEYLVQSFDWNSSGSSFEQEASILEDRLQIGLISSQLTIPFKMTFTGMLGQHNHWGTQLPFYNLAFLWLLFQRPPPPWWVRVLPALTLVAAVLNTSRFAMLSILLTDIVFFATQAGVRRWIKRLIFGIPLGLILINAGDLIELGETYIDMTNTFQGRMDTWGGAWPMVLTRGPVDLLIGSPASTITAIQRQFDWEDFENLALSMLMEKGIISFMIFLIMLVKIWRATGDTDPLSRTTLRMMVVCMILVSLWSNVLLRATSFGVVALLLCGTVLPKTQSGTSDPDPPVDEESGARNGP